MNQRDFGEAYSQPRQFFPPEIFWYPLMQTAALAFLDRREEAAAAVGESLKLKSDFLERSHWLIRRYVKFDDLVQCIEDGLAKADLQMKPW